MSHVRGIHGSEESKMLNTFIKSCLDRLAVLLHHDGQNAAEYALTVAMIALVAVAGMESLATGISHTFLTVSATLGQHLQ